MDIVIRGRSRNSYRFKEEVLSGSAAAIKDLMELCEDITYAVINERLPRYEREDIAQEVSIGVWRNMKSYDPAKDIVPWVVTIAKNKVTDTLRRRKRRAKIESNISSIGRENHNGRLEVECNKDGRPEYDLQRLQNSVELERAMQRVPLVNLETLRLKYIAELSQREVADMLGIPIGTVKSRLSNAIIGLRENMISKEYN